MDFRILGPLEAVADGRVVAPDAAKPRALLAILLLHAGEPVSRDRLIEDLWDGQPAGHGGEGPADVRLTAPQGARQRGDRHPPCGLRARRRGGRLSTCTASSGSWPKQGRASRPSRPRACARRSRSGAGRRSPTSPTSRGRRPRSADSRSSASPRSRIASTRISRSARRPTSSASSSGSSASTRSGSGCAASSCSRSTARGRQAEALAAYRDARRALVDDARHRADARAPAARTPDPRPGSVARPRYRRAAGRRCGAAGAEPAESLVVLRRPHARAARDRGASSPRRRAAPDVDRRRPDRGRRGSRSRRRALSTVSPTAPWLSSSLASPTPDSSRGRSPASSGSRNARDRAAREALLELPARPADAAAARQLRARARRGAARPRAARWRTRREGARHESCSSRCSRGTGLPGAGA